MARLRFWIVVLAISAGTIGLLAAEILPAKPASYFNDYAGVVDRATALQLNEQLEQFERETSTQLVVAVYPTMQSESSVADYTYRVKETWGVGQKGRNNGAVLFVFVQNHQMFIQTNYGLEGALPDATCLDITHNVIAPFFKKDDYTAGLRGGVNAMMAAVKGEYKGSGKTVAESKNSAGGFPIGLIIFLAIIAFFIFKNRSRRGRRGYGYSPLGGPFIGGFGGGGFGGGSSGGGGGFGGFSGGGGTGGGGGAGSSW